MNIIGLDISSGYATAFLLDQLPTNFKEYLESREAVAFEVRPTEQDLSSLVSLGADCIILEPTGYHLERVFCAYFDRHGQQWRRATGKRVASFRNERGIAKTDANDAFSLAAYGLVYWNDPKAFLPRCELEELRQLWLQRRGLGKSQIRLINRLRQQMQHEFHEVADKDWERRWGDQPYGLIRWLAGEELDKRVQTRWDNLHHRTIGCGVSNYSQQLAAHLNAIQRQMQAIELEIDRYLAQERFQPYIEAMNKLGLSPYVQSIWLTRIYPFSRFLDAEGRVIEVKRASSNGKLCTYNRSLAQFKAALGIGMTENSSGTRQPRQKQKQNARWRGRSAKPRSRRDDRPEVPMGCRFCREAFFLWSVNKLEPKHTHKPELGVKLAAKRDELKEKGVNLYQRSGNLQGYAARLLFRELKRRLLDS